VHPVSVSIVVSAPREQVFDYLQDVANRPEFTDHYLVDWHLTRPDPVGLGAGARFRAKHPRMSRYTWADMTLIEVVPPHRIVEAGRTGKDNRIRTLSTWELVTGSHETTRVTLTVQTDPATHADRFLEMLGARRRVRRHGARALKRLRAALETGRTGTRRITVAGG